MAEAMHTDQHQGTAPTAAQAIETELNRAREQAIRGVLLAGAAVATLAYLAGLVTSIIAGDSLARYLPLGAAVALAWTLAVVRRLPIYLRAGLLVLLIFVVGIEDVFSVGLAGQVRQDFLVVIILAAGLLGVRAGFLSFGLSILALGILSWLLDSGAITLTTNVADPTMAASSWLVALLRFVASILAVTFVVYTLLRSLRAVLSRQRQLLAQLLQERREAEARVNERSAALQVAAELSSNIAVLQEREQLILTLVERIRATFNYYYLHIYLFDADRENLVVAGGTGEMGRALFVGGHRMKLGEGLVGRAAARNETILVPDVSQEPDWRPNQMLPDTRSELVIPIVVDGEVFGVLDVQHDKVNGLTDEDVNLLKAIANQVGIAVQNAELFRKAERQAMQQARLTEIRRKIFLAPDLDQLTQVVARELAQAARVESSRIQLKHTPLVIEDER